MAQVSEVVKTNKVPKRSFKQRFSDYWYEAKKNKVMYLMMAPFIIIFFTFTVLPVIAGLYLSFTYFNILQPPKFIGWSNYALLFLDDDIFLTAVKNTVLYALVVGPGGFFISWALAWLINQIKYRVAYTMAFYIPSVTGASAIGVIFMVLFSGDHYGYLNYIMLRLGIFDEPFIWLQDVRTMMPIVILVSLWMSMGANFLVFLAGFQNIDHELYEAGRVDGIRTRWQEAWYITLPMMKPQLLFGAVNQVVRSFEVSGVATALTGNPSPLYATHTILTHMQDYAFTRFEMGYASAISFVLFVIMFSLSRVFMRVFSTKGQY
jgi:multiple sugar transport system permease protein